MLKDIFNTLALSLTMVGTPAISDDFTGDEIRNMFFEPKYEFEEPVCMVDGVNVEYREIPSDIMMIHRYGKLLAFANIDADDIPFIMIDRAMLSSVNPVFREHVLRHECAHHTGQHFSPFGGSDDEANEDEADCLAIINGKLEGVREEDLEVIESFNRALVQAFYPRKYKEGEADVRNEKLRSCYFYSNLDM